LNAIFHCALYQPVTTAVTAIGLLTFATQK